MFSNYKQQKLLTAAAFDKLKEYTDYSQPFPKEGFFIKKKFLNRELSYFIVVEMKTDENNN